MLERPRANSAILLMTARRPSALFAPTVPLYPNRRMIWTDIACASPDALCAMPSCRVSASRYNSSTDVPMPRRSYRRSGVVRAPSM